MTETTAASVQDAMKDEEGRKILEEKVEGGMFALKMGLSVLMVGGAAITIRLLLGWLAMR